MVRAASITVVLALLAPLVIAADGVLEINQACAVNTGCFSGDTPGFPVTIDGSARHSYRLTSDLAVSDASTHGITIVRTTGDVSIDLAGFGIQGPCELRTCILPSGGLGGSGVSVPTAFSTGVSVTNGAIVGMGGAGVSLGPQAQVTHLRASWNRVGIYAGTGSNVSGNTVLGNEAGGISAGDGSTVRGDTVHNNAGLGLNLGSNTTYRENTIVDNSEGQVTGGVNMGDSYCAGTGTVSSACGEHGKGS